MRVAAIDQGTTSTRAIVYEDDVPPRIAHSIQHRQIYPRAGWVEHDPLELLANIRACLAAAGPVDAIGIANQGESCLAWDAVSGEPLSPVIVWQDNRTNDIILKLRAAGAEPEVNARAGLPLDCYFSASKLAWILQNSDGARQARQSRALASGHNRQLLSPTADGCVRHRRDDRFAHIADGPKDIGLGSGALRHLWYSRRDPGADPADDKPVRPY